MKPQGYSASLSQTQGRSGFSIIFRHPVRQDPKTGKPGIRVRRGLSTRDEAEAKQLRGELDVLLSDPKYHDSSARADAARQFDPRVVDIFFDKMVPNEQDSAALRDKVLPLPKSGTGEYRRVVLLGATGAGKTTLVRQLIGTDPAEERFPSTSTAKTTIHDTEIMFTDGNWRAIVTFVPSNEVREHLNECISAAVLSAAKDANDAELLRRLLNHVNQRFRFSYVLGNGPAADPSGSDFDDEEDEPETQPEIAPEVDNDGIDLAITEKLLVDSIQKLHELACRLAKKVRDELDVQGKDDERVADELFEEELDSLLRDEEEFHQIGDALMDEIEKRFDLLPPGNVQKTRQGWPIAWSAEWPVEKRSEFLRAVSRFSSNYAPLFGRLLTPVVDGVRVAGPFSPSWDGNKTPKLVLLDGEGLGHTPKSSSAVSTAVSRHIDNADAVLLVDSATQPMQAATLAAIREVVATGNARKLVIAFTHFDEVKGDNLPGPAAKVDHVLASAENVLAALGEDLGPYAERAFRQQLENARFFLAALHEPLSKKSRSVKRTVSQLRKLLVAINAAGRSAQAGESCPVYDRVNLVLAIRGATNAFHGAWRPRLGLEFKPGFAKEHWTRIKALSRRLAEGWNDEYDTLRPIADLRKELVERLYVFVQNPLRWEGQEPADDEKQRCFDTLADNLSPRLLQLCTRRVWQEQVVQWQDAYYKFGGGSTFVRAQIICDEIYEPAAPVPDVTPSPDRNQFLHEVIAEVEEAAKNAGATLE